MYYLAALGPNCIVQDLSLTVAEVQGLSCPTACGILVPS